MTTTDAENAASNPIAEAEFDALPWIHVYPQYANHDDVRIVGTREALTALADALRVAAEQGAGKAEGITSDGEGYHIAITRTNRTGLGYTSLPYTAEWARDLQTQPPESTRIKELEEALRPFAEYLSAYERGPAKFWHADSRIPDYQAIRVMLGDLRRARRALDGKKE